MNEIFPFILSAGGAAFITAVFLGIKTLRDGQSAKEDSVTKRLNEDAKQAHADADIQRARALAADTSTDEMRIERDRARDAEARMRRQLIRHGIDPESGAGT